MAKICIYEAAVSHSCVSNDMSAKTILTAFTGTTGWHAFVGVLRRVK